MHTESVESENIKKVSGGASKYRGAAAAEKAQVSEHGASQEWEK